MSDLVLQTIGEIAVVAEATLTGTIQMNDPLPDGSSVRRRIPTYTVSAIRVVVPTVKPTYGERGGRPRLADSSTVAGAVSMVVDGKTLSASSDKLENARLVLSASRALDETFSVTISWSRLQRTR